ncbi:aminopeptidase A-like [Sabethes cyaneus]|uniref:aminopeptidase A-like n=1 Tax=Sabethes cyaneus TaxID=53552 RepID=UPI00237E8084|nr:aminopeptidase A-like [Sabethes cyaneus]
MEPSRWCIVLKCAAAVLLIAAVDAQSEKQFRLPKATKPIAYDIELAVDLEESMFSGSVKIELEAVQQTTVLALNAKDLALSNIALTDHNGERMGISSWGDQNGSEIVRFNLESPLEYPRTYFMNIQFAGIITGDLKGLYRSSYYQATEERFIGSTFNAAAYARRIFPCYDEPHLKAKFKLSVQHATDLHVLSNMHVESRTNLTNPENVSLTIFAQSPPMSTYLFAFVLSDYGELRLDSQFAAHAPLGIVNTTGYALNFTKTAIEYLAKFFKRPYQLSKLDIVTIDDFLLGAMENWGLITFK